MDTSLSPSRSRESPGFSPLLRVLLALALFALAPLRAEADGPPPDRPTYTAAVLRDFSPLYQTDTSGNPGGFSIDILGEAARLGNFNVRYLQTENWEEALDAVRTGRADFIPGIGVTPGREREFAFTVPMETVPVNIFVRVGSAWASSLDDLAHRRVAVLSESAAKELLEHSTAIAVPYPNLDSAAFALLAGDVDAYVAPRPVLWEKLRRIGLSDAVHAIEPPLTELKRGWLLRKNDKALLQRLNTALSAVVISDEYARAYARAYTTPPSFWTVRRVALSASLFLAVVLLLGFLWRNWTLARVNRELRRLMDEREEAEEALRDQEQALRIMFDSLNTGVLVVDPVQRRVERVNPAAAGMIGLPAEMIVGRCCTDFICPGGEGLCPILDEGQPMDNSERGLRSADGRQLAILKTVVPVRLQGKDYLLESFVDITRLKDAEEKLKRSLTEKDALLREIHHRVKNNMQIISSLLSLQESATGDLEASDGLAKTRQRIRAMALVHETLYRGGSLSAIDAGAYLRTLAQSLRTAYTTSKRDIDMDLSLPPLAMTPDQAISCGLLVNELLTNCLRHAFEERDKGRIGVSLTKENGTFHLLVEDDGRGMEETAAEPRGLGIQLARSLIDQLGGGMNISTREGGTRVEMTFPA